MKRSLIAVVTVLALASVPSLFAATIYKWVDESGTVHYGERPPEGVDAEPVSVGSSGSVSGGDPYAETRADQAAQKAATAERMAETGAVMEQQQQDRLAAACAAQKARLEQLIPRPKVLLQNPDGTTRMLGDQERLDMIEESQKFIDENCPDN